MVSTDPFSPLLGISGDVIPIGSWELSWHLELSSGHPQFPQFYTPPFSFLTLKKIWIPSQICVPSLHWGHVNLLCIVPVLVYVLQKRALIFPEAWKSIERRAKQANQSTLGLSRKASRRTQIGSLADPFPLSWEPVVVRISVSWSSIWLSLEL